MGLAYGKGMRTRCETYGQYEGKTYCFRNEDAKTEFMKDPPGNRARRMIIMTAKRADPNWTPCDYTTPPTDPNSCN
jgi:YHS domain-containing protein